MLFGTYAAAGIREKEGAEPQFNGFCRESDRRLTIGWKPVFLRILPLPLKNGKKRAGEEAGKRFDIV